MTSEEQTTKSENTSDFVSGSLYQKFLSDYEEYDIRQKEYIASLEKQLSKLINKKKSDETRQIQKLRRSLVERIMMIQRMNSQIERLQEDVDTLKMKNDSLKRETPSDKI